jgi:hypothetical protein
MQTLERLHSELGGQILENKTEALRLAESMRHVEAVIKMLDPTYNLRRIAVKRRQPNPWFKRGNDLPPRCRRAQDCRAAPYGARDCGAGLGRRQYKNRANKAALADLIGTVLASLRNHKGKGVQRANEGTPARWRLKEAAN